LEVPVRVLPKNGAAWETASFDISVGGMFLAGKNGAEIGVEVTLIFELPKLGRVEMPGFIRWTSERGVGIQFGLIGPRETHAIGGLVRQQAVAS
jgi:type IV pilus assembly protein PilZ